MRLVFIGSEQLGSFCLQSNFLGIECQVTKNSSFQETTNKILQIVHVFVEAMKERMENNKDVCVSSSKKVVDNKGLITNMILKLEEERINDEKIAEEALKCPEDGFHDKTEEPNDNNEDPVEENNNEVNSKLTEEQKWLESVVKNVRHFISMQGANQLHGHEQVKTSKRRDNIFTHLL